MNALFEQLRAFGVGRLTAIFGLAAGVAAALVYFSGAVGGGSQSILLAGLDPAEAVSTTQLLDQNNIPYTITQGGTAITVPSDRLDDARIQVAVNGPISGASIGYELFDQQESFGQTSFVQNLNAKRALEGELARTIESMDVIRSARVLLHLPERQLFASDQRQPTAAVSVSARGPLNSENIRAIRNLVATAAGVETNNISIADARGRLLASATDDDTAGSVLMDERRSAVEADLRRKILDVVEGVVGIGAARVQVIADINRQSITESSEEYDPNGSVVRSRNRSDGTSSETGNSRNAVSASENLPDGGNPAGDGAGDARQEENSTDNVEYALSSTRRTEITQAGSINRLSVAVAVDGILQTNEDGTTQWVERPVEQIQQIEALVRSAMGFVSDGVREDSLSVQQFEFARIDPLLGSEATGGMSFDKNDIMRAAEIAVLFITSVLVIFLVARPLVKGTGSAAAPMPQGLALANAGAAAPAGLPQADTPAALPAGPESPAALLAGMAQPATAGDAIDIAKIDGQVKASSVKKVASIVEQHPEESISILRTWLHDT